MSHLLPPFSPSLTFRVHIIPCAAAPASVCCLGPLREDPSRLSWGRPWLPLPQVPLLFSGPRVLPCPWGVDGEGVRERLWGREAESRLFRIHEEVREGCSSSGNKRINDKCGLILLWYNCWWNWIVFDFRYLIGWVFTLCQRQDRGTLLFNLKLVSS